jgi:hypothetical protein
VSFGTIFDERDVAIADVFVNHGVALHAGGVDFLRSDSSQHEARHGNQFAIGHKLYRVPCGDKAGHRNLTK